MVHPPQRPPTVLLHVVLRSFALKRSQMQLCNSKSNSAGFLQLKEGETSGLTLTVFREDGGGDEILKDAAVSVKRTNDLTPNQELAHLFCKFPQFL